MWTPPPVFALLNSAVSALVGQRIYGSGLAPEGVAKPYITWFIVAGDPYNQLSGEPCGDNDAVQIDCYAGPGDSGEEDVVVLAGAVRAALDAANITNTIVVNTREPDTMLFRVGFQAQFIRARQ
jgi:hypothetical protein